MKNVSLILWAALVLTACGKNNSDKSILGTLSSLGVPPSGTPGSQSLPGAPGSVVYVPTPSPVPSPLQEEINVVVGEENAYRKGLGQALISNGLSCTLSTVTGGSYIQSGGGYAPTLTGIVTVATFTHSDVFNQTDAPVSQGLNILPPALKSIYKNLIKLVCSGHLVIVETGYYQFDLTSDDGSVLYLDGARLIDNDGPHGAIMKSGSKYLRRGVHAFRLDFAQTGGGNQALILKGNGDLIPGAFLYH